MHVRACVRVCLRARVSAHVRACLPPATLARCAKRLPGGLTPPLPGVPSTLSARPPTAGRSNAFVSSPRLSSRPTRPTAALRLCCGCACVRLHRVRARARVCVTVCVHMSVCVRGHMGASLRARVQVLCRQHPSETMAEWFAEGLLHRLLSALLPLSVPLFPLSVPLFSVPLRLCVISTTSAVLPLGAASTRGVAALARRRRGRRGAAGGGDGVCRAEHEPRRLVPRPHAHQRLWVRTRGGPCAHAAHQNAHTRTRTRARTRARRLAFMHARTRAHTHASRHALAWLP